MTESLGFSPAGLIFKLSVEDRLSREVCSSRFVFDPDDFIGILIPSVPLWGTLVAMFGLMGENTKVYILTF